VNDARKGGDSMKVIVVGGGIIGCLTACMLKQRGVDCVVLERNTPGHEASWAGAGILCPIHPWLYPDDFSRFVDDSLMLFPQLREQMEQATGVDIQYIESGLMIPEFESDLVSHRDAALAWSRKFNWEVEALSVEETMLMEPSLNGAQLKSSLRWPKVSQLRNPRLLRAVQAWMRQLLIPCVENCHVDCLLESSCGVTGVQDSKGQKYEGDAVLLACGSWSGELAEKWGCSLPVKPVKGQIVLLHGPVGTLHHIVKHDDAYFVPRSDGRVLVGASMEYVGFKKGNTPEVVQALLHAMLRIAPGLKDAEIEHQWMGFRPGSPDGMPYIGPVESRKGLWVASGHYRNGVCLAPATAVMVSRWMTGEAVPEYMHSFLPGRISTASETLGYPEF